MNTDSKTVTISDLMASSGVGFGTSGARGLAEAMTDQVCFAYVMGFLQYLKSKGELRSGMEVALAGDFRPSSPRIMAAVGMAVRDFGCIPVNCGFIPSPAVALFGIRNAVPSLMVTGSHIPDDRNGIKFNRAAGEILKGDEQGIRLQRVTFSKELFDKRGMSRLSYRLPRETKTPYQDYMHRYLDFFPAHCLQGRRIGLYEHSSVARQVLYEILEGLGAEIVRLGFSDRFLPVDTEAVRSEDIELARQWAARYDLDCIVSTDGDGDRPLISDERGHWLRGDVAGILCARYLGARRVVTPVSSNSAVEKCGWFGQVERTRIGSPYVIAAMEAALSKGEGCVVGYEANGGFLIGDRLERDGRILDPLPTRDAVIVALSILMLASEWQLPVSGLLSRLPARFTSSNRLKDFPNQLSRERIGGLSEGGIESLFGENFGRVAGLDDTDGLRITFESGEVVHLRPSGNAPELRCYNEADSEARAVEMNQICMGILDSWRA